MPEGLEQARRSRRPPRYWRALTPALSPALPVPEQRLNGWLLVLEAKKIPHLFFPGGRSPFLYVPPLYEGVALHEILAFEGERPLPMPAPPARENIPGVLFFLLLLIVWHGLRWNWFVPQLPSPPFPSAAEAWSGNFGLDIYRARVFHEWWRAVTALTLHADAAHLFSNVAFGLFFFIPLCRRVGLGLGCALALAAGILGGICNALTRESFLVSLGFSTALFGAVGSLCAICAADLVSHTLRFTRRRVPGLAAAGPAAGDGLNLSLIRRLCIPLASGLALLGILGGGGEARTDYAAHIWGFCCGLLCALAALPLERALAALKASRQRAAQAALFLAGQATLVGAWCYALLR
jgi:membrane associated rhomboid family serine protease